MKWMDKQVCVHGAQCADCTAEEQRQKPRGKIAPLEPLAADSDEQGVENKPDQNGRRCGEPC